MTTPADPWPAPLAPGPLDAVVPVPGSKSLTNRYLVLAALADGPGRLRSALRSRDTDLMVDALRALGTDIVAEGAPTAHAGERPETTDWVITPGTLRGPARIDCGLAGTVMRFLPAVAALADGEIVFDGDEQARARPMGPVLAALRALGVSVRPEGPGGLDALPFTVTGTGRVGGGAVDVDASGSSQFVSGLLLAAPRFERGLTVRHTGVTLPSVPHIDMTVAVLRAAGVEVDDSRPAIWQVQSGPIAARDMRVEPDLSNAGPFLAAALVAGGTVRIPGWPESTTQPGAMLVDLLTEMGASAHLADGELAVTGTGEIRGLDVDLGAAGELTPAIAALAALADTPSRLRGIAHLRGHETDRLAALATEIGRLGGMVEQTADGLVITPRPLRGGTFRTYHDHRMATAGAIIGLRVPDVLVENVATTAKTLPNFAAMWQRMLDSRAGTDSAAGRRQEGPSGDPGPDA